MSNLSEFIGQQWHDIKGNAKWDFIKWTFWGCSMIPSAVTAIATFLRHAPIWEVVLFTFLAFLFGIFIWCVLVLAVLKFGNRFGIRDHLSKTDLEIEPIPSDSKPSKKHPFHIRILNNNPKQNADDLKVEIISFTDNLSSQFQSIAQRYYHPAHFDKMAELKSSTGRNTINPSDGLEFTVFYFESSIRIQGQPRSVIATFDLKGGIVKENVASFHEGKKYQIKFAASARGFAKIEREFNMKFFDDDGVCKIELTPFAPLTKEEKKSEIMQTIGQYQELLNDRYSKINQTEFWEYANQNEYAFENNLMDGDTGSIFAEIEKFLEKEIPGAAADFKDTVNLQLSRINNYDPNGIGEKKRLYYVRAIDHLKHRSNQLAKIKDKLNLKPL